jgi:hypothetical protein
MPEGAPSSADMRAPEYQSGARADGMLLGFALAQLALLLAFVTRYGWFRDEFYYVVCARHPAAGYVDQPPLSILILAVVRALAGESLVAIRLLPALAGAATVFMTGRIARALGGGRFAQAMAACAALLAPVVLAESHYYSMNAFDLLIWTLAGWLTLRIASAAAPRDWLALGAVLGLGLLNKVSVLWLIAGLFAGMLAGPQRAQLGTRWPWIVAAIAALLFAPHLAWQIAHGWPTLEFMRNAAGRKMVEVSLSGFWRNQVRMMSPITVLLWLPGLIWLLFARAARPGRALGVMYAVVATLLIAAGRSRASYLAPAYPALLAGGAIALERWLYARRWNALRVPALVLLIALEAPIVPFALPVLKVESYVRYAHALGIGPSTEEHQRMGSLPQQYADMFGWEELVSEVEKAYRALPADERARCSIFAQNYGEAGAISVLGRARGLPPAMSGHNNFWLWGPAGPGDGSVMIVVGGDRDDNEQVFERLERVGTVRSTYAMPYEQDMPVYVGRGLRIPVAKLWPGLKRYI